MTDVEKHAAAIKKACDILNKNKFVVVAEIAKDGGQLVLINTSLIDSVHISTTSYEIADLCDDQGFVIAQLNLTQEQ